MAEIPPGTQFGPYRISRPLGAGGMGAVYVAVGPSGAEVALKVLPPGSSAESATRFHREAEAHARVDTHPHVARVHSAGQFGPHAYLVMDLLPGGDLKDRLRSGALPPEEVRALGVALASGLAHIHAQGVLHRDVKPANVLFDEFGRPRLTDFGLAREVEVSDLTQSGVILGTPGFMAPEQAGIGEAGIGSDVFGLGATLYAALTGHAPFVGSSTIETLSKLMTEAPPPLPASVPADLRAALGRALEKEPSARYPDMASFAEALQGAALPASSSPWLWAAAGFCLLSLIGLGALFALPESPPLAPTPSPSSTPSHSASATPSPRRAITWPRNPVVLGPGGTPRPTESKTSAVAAAWISDAAFLTVAKGGTWKRWEPDAKGTPVVTEEGRVAFRGFQTALPFAEVVDGWLVWGGGATSPPHYARLTKRGTPGPASALKGFNASKAYPLVQGGLLLVAAKAIALWRPGSETVTWQTPLERAPQTDYISGLLVLEDRHDVEGAALNLLVAWSPNAAVEVARGSGWVERLRVDGGRPTRAWRRSTPRRLRAFRPWGTQILYGDDIGQVCSASPEFEDPRPLPLLSSRRGPLRGVHKGPIRGLELSAAGNLVTLGGELPELCVWNPKTGERLLAFDLSGKLKGGVRLVLSPDRTCALVVGRDRVAAVSITPAN